MGLCGSDASHSCGTGNGACLGLVSECAWGLPYPSLADSRSCNRLVQMDSLGRWAPRIVFYCSCPAQRSLLGSIEVQTAPLHVLWAAPPANPKVLPGSWELRLLGSQKSMVGMWCPGVPLLTLCLGLVHVCGPIVVPGNFEQAALLFPSSITVSALPLC